MGQGNIKQKDSDDQVQQKIKKVNVKSLNLDGINSRKGQEEVSDQRRSRNGEDNLTSRSSRYEHIQSRKSITVQNIQQLLFHNYESKKNNKCKDQKTNHNDNQVQPINESQDNSEDEESSYGTNENEPVEQLIECNQQVGQRKQRNSILNLNQIQNKLNNLMNGNQQQEEKDKIQEQHIRRQSIVHSIAFSQNAKQKYPRLSSIQITEQDYTYNEVIMEETVDASKDVYEILQLRDQYQFEEHQDYQYLEDLIVKKDDGTQEIDFSKICINHKKLKDYEFYLEDGIFTTKLKEKELIKPQAMIQFIDDIVNLMEMTHKQINKSFCYLRLKMLSEKFKMHLLFNKDKEIFQQKKTKEVDFYNTKKVDTHIHHSACMRANQLLKFMKNKLKVEKDSIVYKDKEGNRQTLEQVFNSLDLTSRHVNLDAMGVQADHTIFQRFDKFNQKYNPMGKPQLREIFLKTDNFIQGRFIAELTHEVMDELREDNNILQEWRISVYGKHKNEWNKLAQWVKTNKLYCNQVRWFIQVPRLYQMYKKMKIVNNFQEMIANIFQPIFEVTLNPERDPALFEFLLQVTGFDSVDDESSYEQLQFQELMKMPEDWNKADSPPYIYWIYYLYANIFSLNQLRKARGLNTFSFKPHCGESGNIDHLAACFMLADGICHGIKLEQSPVLQYLYFMKQIPIAVSPLSNNKLFLEYNKNPFPKFFERGLNVSLSTDDPLIIHITKEPLLEEYAVASQVYNLSNVDLTELGNNSVYQCSFEQYFKKLWLGSDYKTKNNNELTNLPDIRYQYRQKNLQDELDLLKKYKK